MVKVTSLRVAKNKHIWFDFGHHIHYVIIFRLEVPSSLELLCQVNPQNMLENVSSTLQWPSLAHFLLPGHLSQVSRPSGLGADGSVRKRSPGRGIASAGTGKAQTLRNFY